MSEPLGRQTHTKTALKESSSHHSPHQPRSQAVGETVWQLPRVQTVYGCDITVIARFHSNSLVHVILTIFPAVRMGLSCSWKQLFAVGSTTEVK